MHILPLCPKCCIDCYQSRQLNTTLHQQIDKTEKFLFQLEDGNTIETVLLRHKDKRNTLCISSQIGCAVKCAFCATGQGGFVRDLNVSEIINQVYTIERRLVKQGTNLNNIAVSYTHLRAHET